MGSFTSKQSKQASHRGSRKRARIASGNSSTESLNVDADAVKATAKEMWTLYGRLLYGEDNDGVSTSTVNGRCEAYSASLVEWLEERRELGELSLVPSLLDESSTIPHPGDTIQSAHNHSLQDPHRFESGSYIRPPSRVKLAKY